MNYIRPWQLSDAKDLANAINNKKVQDNLRDGLPFPYGTRDAHDYIKAVLNAPKDSQYAWAIQIDGKAIGSVGIHRKENIHRQTAELGYYVCENYWGMGIVTNAVKEACEYVLTHTDMRSIKDGREIFL